VEGPVSSHNPRIKNSKRHRKRNIPRRSLAVSNRSIFKKKVRSILLIEQPLLRGGRQINGTVPMMGQWLKPRLDIPFGFYANPKGGRQLTRVTAEIPELKDARFLAVSFSNPLIVMLITKGRLSVHRTIP